jgi:DMSO/TMAO reductase YedYZ molybdopterin-dependent catalytic subunit
MIVRSTRPEDLETPLAGFADFITPIDRFFVRTHVPVPRVDIGEWRLKVDGEVASPLTLSMQDLHNMPPLELISVLECAGNGRAFFNPPVPGLQWENGAVGNGRWRGVRLRDVLQRAGVNAGAVEVLFDGADVPLGSMADFQRSIPTQKALHPDTLLAYEMNGEPLPQKHGFPLRVVAPGWAGDSWVKWVTGIRVLKQPHDGYWMKSAYLYPNQPATPGAVVPADEMHPVTSLRIKSVITSPAAEAHVELRRRVLIRGFAWGGDSAVVRGVDVTVDGGRSWRPARLTGQTTQYGWRPWEFPWMPTSDGYIEIMARARDSRGNVQPSTAEWNPSGYLWNGIMRVTVAAGKAVQRPGAFVDRGPTTAPAGFQQTCLVCHDADVIWQQRLTRDQWNRELDKMQRWGARLSPEDRDRFLDFLAGRR